LPWYVRLALIFAPGRATARRCPTPCGLRPGRLPSRPLAAGAVVVAVWLAVASTSSGQAPPQPTTVPADAVPLIDSRPVPKADFDHWIAIVAAQWHSEVPAPDSPEYAVMRDQVMQQLISGEWLELEAAERGIRVTERAVRRAFLRHKREAFPRDAVFRRFLKRTGQTEADILDRVRSDLLTERIRRQVMAKARTRAGRDRLIERFARRFHRKWRSRTVCGEGYTVRQCSRTLPIAPPASPSPPPADAPPP